MESQGGCIWSAVLFVLSVIVLYALLAGVDVNGSHYELRCGSSGVEIRGGR
jgi:hypothetical protein